MIGDPIGDVTDGRGDVEDATFLSDVDALQGDRRGVRGAGDRSWRRQQSHRAHLDLDGDGVEEYEVMLRWMYGGQIEGEPVTDSSARYLCDVGQHIREHDVLRQYSFIALPECLGYPTRIWWRGEMIHCYVTTGAETIDHFPDEVGWSPAQHPPVGVTAPVAVNPQLAPPIQPCGPGAPTTTSRPADSTTTGVANPTTMPSTPPTPPPTTPSPTTPDPTPVPSAVPQISVVDRIATAAVGARRGG